VFVRRESPSSNHLHSHRAAEPMADERLMAEETWLTAHEAKRLGFADVIEQPVRMAASFDLLKFKSAPKFDAAASWASAIEQVNARMPASATTVLVASTHKRAP
jgi:hypothetical protein